MLSGSLKAKDVFFIQNLALVLNCLYFFNPLNAIVAIIRCANCFRLQEVVAPNLTGLLALFFLYSECVMLSPLFIIVELLIIYVYVGHCHKHTTIFVVVLVNNSPKSLLAFVITLVLSKLRVSPTKYIWYLIFLNCLSMKFGKP